MTSGVSTSSIKVISLSATAPQVPTTSKNVPREELRIESTMSTSKSFLERFMAPVTLQASCLRAGVNTVDTNDALKRSIDTLQRIYAVVAALAIGEALRRAVLKGGGPAHTLQVSWSDIQLPLCVAVLVTVIPFVHGMNRHLDEHMADLAVPAKRSRMVATLMLDFLIFAIQCCVLFSLGGAVDSPGPTFYRIFLALLLIDIFWAILRSLFELQALDWNRIDGQSRDDIIKQVLWAAINIVAVLAVIGVESAAKNDLSQARLLGLLAVIRSGADYWFARDIYFPQKQTAMSQFSGA
jgi:hypothetical protein